MKGLSVKEAISLAAESTCGKQALIGEDTKLAGCPAVQRCLTGVKDAASGALSIAQSATSWLTGTISSVAIVHVGCKGREIRSTDIFSTERVRTNEPTDRYAKSAVI